MDFSQYKGMSYEQMSRKAADLIAIAHESGEWFSIVDVLHFLRGEMLRATIGTSRP